MKKWIVLYYITLTLIIYCFSEVRKTFKGCCEISKTEKVFKTLKARKLQYYRTVLDYSQDLSLEKNVPKWQ